MHPKHHAFWGFVGALILINYFNVTDFNALIFWISSWFLIDLDHAVRFTLLKRSVNPFRFLVNSVKEKKKIISSVKSGKRDFAYPFFMFHSVEVVVVIFILGNYFSVLFYVALGFLFHLIYDWFNLAKAGLDVFSKVSIIYLIIRNKNKKSLM
jgi:hypothetical protein